MSYSDNDLYCYVDIESYEISVNSIDDLYLENTTYYSIESTNYIYLIKYAIYDSKKGDREDIDTHPCYVSKDDFIKNIKVK